MGKELYQSSSLLRNSIDEFAKIAQIHGFPSFVSLIDGSLAKVDQQSPIMKQVGLVALEMALARLWASGASYPVLFLDIALVRV